MLKTCSTSNYLRFICFLLKNNNFWSMHIRHIFFLALKNFLFFVIFLQIPLDLQRDIDRKIEFFSNPKLSVYYMCHICTNQFYDSDSFIDRYCLKIFNFESIHYRHTIFFCGEFFWKFSSNSAGFTTGYWSKNWTFFKSKIERILHVPHVYKSILWLWQLHWSILSQKKILSLYTSGTPIFFWIFLESFFESISRCESSGIWRKFSKKFPTKKIGVPEVYRLKI